MAPRIRKADGRLYLPAICLCCLRCAANWTIASHQVALVESEGTDGSGEIYVGRSRVERPAGVITFQPDRRSMYRRV